MRISAKLKTVVVSVLRILCAAVLPFADSGTVSLLSRKLHRHLLYSRQRRATAILHRNALLSGKG